MINLEIDHLSWQWCNEVRLYINNRNGFLFDFVFKKTFDNIIGVFFNQFKKTRIKRSLKYLRE